MAIQKEKFKGKMRYRFSTYYDTPDGIHRRKGSKWYNSKKEAEAAEREFLSQPVQAEKKGRTFSKLMDEWILESGRDNTAATRDDKRRILTLYCQTIMDKMYSPLHQLTFESSLKTNISALFPAIGKTSFTQI